MILVRDIYCRKDDWDRGFYAVLDYQNIATKEVASDFVPLRSMLDKVVGFQYKREDKYDTRVLDNVSFNRKVHILNISKADVDGYSKILLKHLGYDKTSYPSIKGELEKILVSQGMQSRIGYVGSHIIQGTQGNADIDYYILPSYEVMRYFFITNTKLSQILLENLGSVRCNPVGVIKGVCEKISDRILVNASGQRVASLFIKQGFKRDIPLLARVAYIKHAHKCLGFLQSSIYKSGIPDAEYEYRHLLTRIPQSEPFKMAVCGKEFVWRGKKYLYINQIYDTKETFPYDKIIYEPLGKDSRMFNGNVEGVREYGGRQGVKSIPGTVTGLSHTEPGGTDGVGEILLSVRTGYRFDGNPKILEEKAPKTEQDLRGEGFGTAEIEKIEATTNTANIDPNSTKGRLEAVADPKLERNPRRECFFAALSMQKEYSVQYLKAPDCTFVSEEVYTDAKSKKHYNILCCGLVKDGCCIYVVRCDGSMDDKSRYAFFHSENFAPLGTGLLRKFHDDVWKYSGINIHPQTLNLSGLISYYQKHNQGILDAESLMTKILEELNSLHRKYTQNTTFL